MANSSDPSSVSLKTYLWRYVAVGVAAAIVTVPSIFYDFVQDDHLLIVDNPIQPSPVGGILGIS